MVLSRKIYIFFTVTGSIAWVTSYIVSNILHFCLDRESLSMCHMF